MNDPLSFNRVDPVHGPSFFSSLWLLIWPAQPLPEQSRTTAQKRLIFAAALAFFCFAVIGAKAFHLATTSKNTDTEVYVRLPGAVRLGVGRRVRAFPTA